jgi:hypothetical protein
MDRELVGRAGRTSGLLFAVGRHRVRRGGGLEYSL